MTTQIVVEEESRGGYDNKGRWVETYALEGTNPVVPEKEPQEK